MGRDTEEERDRADLDGDGVRADESDGCGGRGKKKFIGFHANLLRSDGLRTFRTILKDRRARFACGTYLFAYAIFSEYIPLAKKSSRVVTATKSMPVAMYG